MRIRDRRRTVRASFDFQIERAGFNVYGMVMHANDDRLAGGDMGNTVEYVEGFYPFTPSGISIPMLVPLVRVDFLDEFTDLTANINFYVQGNIKAYLEWWQNLDAPARHRKDNRVTVQIDMTF